jgi:hypothetical protein
VDNARNDCAPIEVGTRRGAKGSWDESTCPNVGAIATNPRNRQKRSTGSDQRANWHSALPS